MAAAEPLTYAISYGLAGGPWQAARLRKLLNQTGFRPASLTDADIIIAHSAGCWLIPQDCHPKLLLYIGMPLAQVEPFKVWRAANLNNIRTLSWRAAAVHAKTLYYNVRQPLRNLRIMRQAKTAKPFISANCPSIFIANRYDPWPRGPELEAYVESQDWTFLSLPGTHDNIWERPEDYVAIVEHFASSEI